MKSKTIATGDNERVIVHNEGSVGVGISRQTKDIRSQRWKTIEDVIVAPEAISAVCSAMLAMRGARNVQWDI